MFRRFTKKRYLALTAVVAVAVAAGAFAAFTGAGSGSGTATVGTDGGFTLVGTTSGPLYPGQSATVSFTATNNGHGNQQLGTISLAGVKACPSGSNWNASYNNNAGACLDGSNNVQTEVSSCESSSQSASSTTADFSMASVTEGTDIPSSQTYGAGKTNALANNTGTLTMNDLTTSQDTCKNANLYLVLSSS